MSSHSRPTGPAGPHDPYADGAGAYGYDGSGAYGEYNEYGEQIQSGGHTYGAYGEDLTYAQRVAYAQQGQQGDPQWGYQEQSYADQGYYPDQGHYAEPARAAAEPTTDPADAPDDFRPAPRSAPRPVSRTGTRTQMRAAARARARRKRRMRNSFLGVGSVAAVAVIAVAAFLHPEAQKASAAVLSAPTVDSGRGSSAPVDASRSVTRPTPTTALTQLPGLGPKFRAQVPANAQQVLLVTGAGKNADTSKAVLYTRTADGTWMPGTAWAAHNAKDGWTSDHMAGDLHSPIGVFSLTDAGGLDANPGTKLPYLHSSAFKAVGTGFEGESLADAFDYVVAINYNHTPGTSPLSTARPMGASRGGGIWIHVDHGGPTHGCVSLAKADMALLLRDLDPSKHPVVVMGDATSLSA